MGKRIAEMTKAEMQERLERQAKKSAERSARYRARTAAQGIRIVTTRIRDVLEQYKKDFVPVAVWIKKKDLQIYKNKTAAGYTPFIKEDLSLYWVSPQQTAQRQAAQAQPQEQEQK